MPEKRMLIVDADVAKKIEENRGDMTVSEFINFLIESQLKSNTNRHGGDHVTKEEFKQFEQGIKELLRSFLEFFLSYGLELGRHSSGRELEELSNRLRALGFEGKNR